MDKELRASCDAQEPVADVVKLSPMETQIILAHAAIRKTMEKYLEPETVARIMSLREHLHVFAKANGDAGRIAIQLFTMEFDNTKNPYGDAFTVLEPVDWDEAIKLWQEGYPND